ncbi:hypothetical protein ZEAMMB73_Zm00001d028077 [Zea mays]|uniref:Uncharacterized protein n=1 Tax=Zea mays TaxID=4577 RepID=A0A1D6JRT8_MAIZE|nr:hypothetical protein ZEAMMB73_Zm00001d028077 [Zea mays]
MASNGSDMVMMYGTRRCWSHPSSPSQRLSPSRYHNSWIPNLRRMLMLTITACTQSRAFYRVSEGYNAFLFPMQMEVMLLQNGSHVTTK